MISDFWSIDPLPTPRGARFSTIWWRDVTAFTLEAREMDAPHYNGAPGEMPYDQGAGRRARTEAPEPRQLGHCHDCAEDGELVPAVQWFDDGLRELPMCAEHFRVRDNYEPPARDPFGDTPTLAEQVAVAVRERERLRR